MKIYMQADPPKNLQKVNKRGLKEGSSYTALLKIRKQFGNYKNYSGFTIPLVTGLSQHSNPLHKEFYCFPITNISPTFLSLCIMGFSLAFLIVTQPKCPCSWYLIFYSSQYCFFFCIFQLLLLLKLAFIQHVFFHTSAQCIYMCMCLLTYHIQNTPKRECDMIKDFQKCVSESLNFSKPQFSQVKNIEIIGSTTLDREIVKQNSNSVPGTQMFN